MDPRWTRDRRPVVDAAHPHDPHHVIVAEENSWIDKRNSPWVAGIVDEESILVEVSRAVTLAQLVQSKSGDGARKPSGEIQEAIVHSGQPIAPVESTIVIDLSPSGVAPDKGFALSTEVSKSERGGATGEAVAHGEAWGGRAHWRWSRTGTIGDRFFSFPDGAGVKEEVEKTEYKHPLEYRRTYGETHQQQPKSRLLSSQSTLRDKDQETHQKAFTMFHEAAEIQTYMIKYIKHRSYNNISTEMPQPQGYNITELIIM
ncbi:hypothetical protein QJS10_CPB20g00604 [Acorus calamus]|uniref:Uncharacterized protein n=1 Tax=Acorus calamus TaxID=4465 RepID=A0AAV9CDV6_ACOCL|nr:hypothetical protein QJS10_CPB20g00604 [Acorus calamus]